MNSINKITQIACLCGLMVFTISLPVQSQDSNWYIGFDIAKTDGELTGSNDAVGITMGYQFSNSVSFDLTNRVLVSGDGSGQLTSAMAVWRSRTEQLYYKLSGGLTYGSGDLFEDNSGSFGLGFGYAADSQWSIELDVIRLSDDVNAVSISTQYRF